MPYYINEYLRETPEEAGYVSVQPQEDNEYLLTSEEGAVEVWFANPNGVAGYAIVLEDGTELEFARTVDSDKAFFEFMNQLAGERNHA